MNVSEPGRLDLDELLATTGLAAAARTVCMPEEITTRNKIQESKPASNADGSQRPLDEGTINASKRSPKKRFQVRTRWEMGMRKERRMGAARGRAEKEI